MTDFSPEDFAHVADLLNKAINGVNERAFHAVLSNNYNIILAALRFTAVGLATLEEAGMECDWAEVERMASRGRKTE
jgi:hypothetical protein